MDTNSIDKKALLPLSRRTLLKAAGVFGAGTVLPACSSSSDGDEGVAYADHYEMDKNLTNAWSTGPHNCGMRCKHKLHINRNGRVVAFTSEGDQPRNTPGLKESDESLEDPQKRACVRGYSYIKRCYQPDRLKYPLLQTSYRGDPNGFKRITWEQALDYVAEKIRNAQTRAQTLGYLPIKAFWDVCKLFAKNSATGTYPLGYPAMAVYGNASFGNIAAALWDGIGYDSAYNSAIDMLNSKLVICWAVDVTTSFGHQGASYWFYNKAREAGVPIVVIDTKYSDTAATMGTGATYSGPMGAPGSTQNTSKKIPAWIPVRPGTDIAMTAAMAYVIYRNNLYDEAFLRKHVYGFFKGDMLSVYQNPLIPSEYGYVPANSLAPDFLLKGAKNLSLEEQYKAGSGNYQKPPTPSGFVGIDDIYTYDFYNPVPGGESFEEYLAGLERERSKGGWLPDGTNPGAGIAEVNGADYDAASVTDKEKAYKAVLAYAEMMTGVAADTIEALARLYATVSAARLDGGGGPQREYNGMYYAWMNIALAAMTGNSDRKGGGPGYSMFNEAGTYNFNQNYLVGMGNRLPPKDQFLVSIDKAADMIFTGSDGRTRAQIAEDFKDFHGLDKSSLASDPAEPKMIEIDMLLNCANHVSSMPNTNKMVMALTEKNGSNYLLKDVITIDHFMTPTAMYSDLVLPAAHHWEVAGVGLYSMPDLFYMAQAIDVLGEARPDKMIWEQVAEKLGLGASTYSLHPAYQDAVNKGTYEYLGQPSKYYTDKYGPVTMPTYEEFKQMGRVNLPHKQYNPMIGMKDINPISDRTTGTRGLLGTTTGLINLYSPYYSAVRPGRVDSYGPKYIPNPEGYEQLIDANGNFTGYTSPDSNRSYTLQLITDKPKNRAHTVFDNVAVIKDRFPQTCKINPVDAGSRGIKEGDMVYVYNDRGCTKIPAEITHRTPPGVIRVQHGAWYRPHPTEKIKVWQKIGHRIEIDPVTMARTEVWDSMKVIDMPVDMGGCENILTLDLQNGPRDPLIGGSIYVQGCICEVSLVKPE